MSFCVLGWLLFVQEPIQGLFYQASFVDWNVSHSERKQDFLACIKDKRLPGDLMDVFDEAQCRYYDGIYTCRDTHLAIFLNECID